MTDSPVDSGGSAENGPDQQDLTQIEGIGEAKQQWLESIGFQTLQDLASADAEAIESALEAIGHPTNLSVISNWISQAQQLLEEIAAQETSSAPRETSGETPAEPNPTASTESEQTAADASSESLPTAEEVEAESTAEERDTEAVKTDTEETEEWQTFASFTVEFESKQIEDEIRYQTSVRHIETDRARAWSGIEEENLQSWLREQLADAIPIMSASTAAASSKAKTRLTPLIEDLRIYQPPSIKTPMGLYQPSRMFPSPIRSNLPFTLELQFRIQEQDVLAKTEEKVLYQVECYSRSLKKGGAFLLGQIPPTPLLSDQRGSYTARFPTMNLQSGIFRLQVLLNLQGINAFPAYFEIPALQVD